MKLIKDQDLENWFNYYNKQFFGNKLHVDNIGFGTRKAGSYLGKAIGTYDSFEKKVINVQIVINPFLRGTDYINTLLHEMIHVWQFEINPSSKGHDIGFKKMAKMINMHGFNVVVAEKEENLPKEMINFINKPKHCKKTRVKNYSNQYKTYELSPDYTSYILELAKKLIQEHK